MFPKHAAVAAWSFSLLIASALTAQARPIPEQDIARVKVELDSVADRMTGGWMIATKGYHRSGLSDYSDDLDGNPSAMSLTPSSATPLSFAIVSTESGPVVGAYFRYQGTGWVFLTGKMYLLVDDSLRFELEGKGIPARSEVGTCSASSCKVTESAVFIVPDSVLSALAAAHSAEVRVVGERRSLDRRLKKQHLALARALWARQHPAGQ
jgi:hypothetical protein